MINYHKKAIYLKNAGDQISKNEVGNVYIKLNVAPDDKVKIEEDYFCVYKNILGIQSIVGDESEIEIFGRKLKFFISRGSTEIYIKDKRAALNLEKVFTIISTVDKVK